MDDLLGLTSEELAQLGGDVDKRTLALSMKTASVEVTHAILGALPPTDLGRFSDSLDIMGPVTVAELESAQREVLDRANALKTKDTTSCNDR